MLKSEPLSLDKQVNLLKAVGETTRLRLLALLSQGDLTVTDLIDILGQSQPRISRHLKLLADVGLLERYQEGAWAYFRFNDEGAGGQLVRRILNTLDLADAEIVKDFGRLADVRKRRADVAQGYFAENAAKWDELRSFYVEERLVEEAMLKAIGDKPFPAMLDLGTGTARLLELFSHLYEKGVGVDASRDMLAVARNNLDRAGLSRVQVRQGDLYVLPTPANSFDLVTCHQVLHYLEDPARAIREASKALAPGGRLLVVDFAPHTLEVLRDEHAHLRLGFENEQIIDWMHDTGLELIDTQEIGGREAEQNGKLKVRYWLAKDTRMQSDAIGLSGNLA